MKHLAKLLRWFLLDPWREMDREAVEARGEAALESASGPLLTVYIFTVVAISLTLQEYFGDRHTFFRIVNFIDSPFSQNVDPFLYSLVGWIAPQEGSLYGQLQRGGDLDLWVLSYWAGWRVLGFLIIPAIAILVHPRLRFNDVGLRLKGTGRHLWIYLAMFILVFIPVFVVSFFEEFSSYYPFYSNAHRSLFDFAVWELFYVAQFFSLEFFFRGFMLQPLRRQMGMSAILAMNIPYVMIHFGKPLPECFAAIIAGIVLGTMAMRTRSIWGGFLVHVGVALSMDALAIWQNHW